MTLPATLREAVVAALLLAGLTGLIAPATAVPKPKPAAPTAPPAPACAFHAQRDAQGQVVLHFTLRNDGPQALQLLRWNSPFEGGWFGRFVRVRAGAEELPFQGAMRKRGEPSARDYLLLPAGQALQATLTLNDAFTLPAARPLTIQAGWRWHDVMTSGTPPRPRSAHQGLDQDCSEVTLAP